MTVPRQDVEVLTYCFVADCEEHNSEEKYFWWKPWSVIILRLQSSTMLWKASKWYKHGFGGKVLTAKPNNLTLSFFGHLCYPPHSI
jgi:hypothetical protein